MRKTNFSSAYISFPGSLYVDENLKIFAKLYNEMVTKLILL